MFVALAQFQSREEAEIAVAGAHLALLSVTGAG